MKQWKRTEAEDKTYANFKTHIRKEYNELRKVGALTVSQLHINPQVNHTTQENLSKDNLTSAITNKLRSTIMNVIMTINQGPEDVEAQQPVQQVNNTTEIDAVVQLTKMVQSLQEQIDKLSKKPQDKKGINPKTGNHGNGIAICTGVATTGDAHVQTRLKVIRMKRPFAIAWSAATRTAYQQTIDKGEEQEY